jgi:hypothetical protein
MEGVDRITNQSISYGKSFKTELNGSNMETIPEDTSDFENEEMNHLLNSLPK